MLGGVISLFHLLYLFVVTLLGLFPVSECKINTNDYKLQIGIFDSGISKTYEYVYVV
jgi:hypothetical protein